MQKIWKCVFLATVTLFLAACSSGGGGVVAVSSYADLEECTSATEGSVRLVSDENLQYRCTDGDWEEYVPVAQSPAQGGYSGAPSWGGKGQLRDSRDGQTYRTVTIGNQTWMAQNLNYETEDSYCYDDKPANCATYGRLYIWKATLNACPSGWHLPSRAEWQALVVTVDGSITEYTGSNIAAKKLMSASGWSRNGNGTDDYSFSALPAGHRLYDGDYGNERDNAYFWSSTESNSNSDYAYYVDMSSGDDDVFLTFEGKYNGYSVRCIKD